MNDSKRRQLLRNVLTACMSLVVFAVLAEVLLTLIVPLVFRPRFTRLDPHLGWYHTPGASEMGELEGHRYRLSYNSHGYRAPDRPYEKPTGRQRVVVLGDSF